MISGFGRTSPGSLGFCSPQIVRKMSNDVKPGHQGCGFGGYFSDLGVEEGDTSWIIMLCTNSHFD